MEVNSNNERLQRTHAELAELQVRHGAQRAERIVRRSLLRDWLIPVEWAVGAAAGQVGVLMLLVMFGAQCARQAGAQWAQQAEGVVTAFGRSDCHWAARIAGRRGCC